MDTERMKIAGERTVWMSSNILNTSLINDEWQNHYRRVTRNRKSEIKVRQFNKLVCHTIWISTAK